MRIVLISPEYPGLSRAGGIGTVTSVIASGLARRGHETHVITRGRPGSFRDKAVRVLSLRHRWLPNRAAFELATRRRIAAAVARLGPDIVQASEWSADAWWVARAGRMPVITRLATPTYLVELLNRGRTDGKSALIRWLERDQTRSSAAVIAPSKAIADRVSLDWGLGTGRVEVFPNPVDVDGVREAARAGAPAGLPELFLAFIGRMERRKGIGVLGAALPTVLAALPGVHAVMIGADPQVEDGRLMREFHRETESVRGRIHFLGELPRETALAVVARASAVVLPSLWENFASVCLEAMALGRPVVATRAGGFTEIVEDGRSGWLVPPGDVRALADRLTSVLSDPPVLERVGEEARRRAEEFDVETVTESLLNLYGRIIAGHRRR